MGQFDVAQVCPNGHVANSSHTRNPEFSTKFCEKCGEATITQCPNESCKIHIRGRYFAPNEWPTDEYAPPAYCLGCGKAFPWTERAIQAAIELLTETGELNEEEQEQFNVSIREIGSDTPRAKLAGTRVASTLKKVKKETGELVRGIVVDVASEAVKKMIWPASGT